MSEDKPNPGSDEAIKLGCRCPVIDNHHGAGIPTSKEGVVDFWINYECVMHASAEVIRQLEAQFGGDK